MKLSRSRIETFILFKRQYHKCSYHLCILTEDIESNISKQEGISLKAVLNRPAFRNHNRWSHRLSVTEKKKKKKKKRRRRGETSEASQVQSKVVKTISLSVYSTSTNCCYVRNNHLTIRKNHGCSLVAKVSHIGIFQHVTISFSTRIINGGAKTNDEGQA
jgi:hypothetical protein